MYRPSNPARLANQQGRNVGVAIVAMLNALPEDRLLKLHDNED